MELQSLCGFSTRTHVLDHKFCYDCGERNLQVKNFLVRMG